MPQRAARPPFRTPRAMRAHPPLGIAKSAGDGEPARGIWRRQARGVPPLPDSDAWGARRPASVTLCNLYHCESLGSMSPISPATNPSNSSSRNRSVTYLDAESAYAWHFVW